MKIIYIIFFVFFYTSSLYAQIWEDDLIPCGVVAPSQANEKSTEASPSTVEFDDPKIIPVVFHVLHQSGVENVSREDLLGILERLNQDYSKANPNLPNSPVVFKNQAADIEVDFKLATKDPEGNCTDGINRIYTEKTKFSQNYTAPVHWPTEKYLNIYICQQLISPSNEFTFPPKELPTALSGFASFPDPANNFFSTWEGVFVTSRVVRIVSEAGNPLYERNFSVLSHEIGHWLNLFHIWGDDDGSCTGTDYVNDTPNQADPSRKCNDDFPFITCNNGPNGNMFCNFMDYGDCTTMFTEGQKSRVNTALNGTYRNQIWQAGNLAATGVMDGGANFSCPTPPKTDFATNTSRLIYCEPNISVTFSERCYQAIPTEIEWFFPGASPVQSTDQTVTVSYPAAGNYEVILVARNSYGADTLIRTLTIQAFPNDTYAAGTKEDFETANSISDVGAAYNGLGGIDYTVCTTAGFNSARSLLLPRKADDFIASFWTRKFQTTATDTLLTFKAARSADGYASLVVFAQTECLDASSNLGAFRETLLNAAPFTNGDFYPNNDHWKSFSLVIPPSLRNRNDVQFLFGYSCSRSNNFFIDDIQVTSSSITAVNAPSSASTFDLFPNPVVDGSFTYEIKGVPFEGAFCLYDMYGKLVMQREVSRGSGTIDINGIQPGIYFCQPVSVKTQETFLPKKIILF